MRAEFRLILIVALVAWTSAPGAAASRLRVFTPPFGFTVSPEGDARLVTVGPDGSVYAIAGSDRAVRLLRWSPDGTRTLYEPKPDPYARSSSAPPPHVIGVAPTTVGVVVTSERWEDGAYLRAVDTSELWIDGATGKLVAPCASMMQASAADGARAAATSDDVGFAPAFDPDDAHAREDHLPRAFVLEDDGCRYLGIGFLTAIRGANAAGYVGFRDGHEWPTASIYGGTPPHALRWIGRARRDLGPGVALAIARDGTAAGASLQPGQYAASKAPSHAVAWDRAGRLTTLLRDDSASVAWAMNDAGTIVGAMRDEAGKHYAFRRIRGRVQRLDDLPHPAGVRFEAAYDIASDGTIFGTGTRDGRAVVFAATF